MCSLPMDCFVIRINLYNFVKIIIIEDKFMISKASFITTIKMLGIINNHKTIIINFTIAFSK